MNPTWEKTKQVIDRHRITYGVIGALLIAMLLTAISLSLYVSSGASRLDLSRPGYESARGDIEQNTNETPFSSTGPLNSDVANEFQQRFTAARDSLNSLDDFNSNALDDAELQIAPTADE